jgi:hypothetical protein
MFDDEQERREREALAVSAGSVLDSYDNPFKSQKALRFFILTDLGIFACAFLFGKWINDQNLEFFLFIISLVGGIGFMITFAGLRFYQKTASATAEVDRIESGVMGGFQYVSSQDRKWHFWLIAAAGGAVNIAVYLAILAFLG